MRGLGKILFGALFIFIGIEAHSNSSESSNVWWWIGIGLILWGWIQRKLARMEEIDTDGLDIKITSSTDTYSEKIDVGRIKKASNGGWVINPKSGFPLTIYGPSKSICEKFKNILENGISESFYTTTQSLIPIATRYNINCKEIDDYIKEFKPQYQRSIKKQISNSSDWAEGSDLDKEDLLSEFKFAAIDALEVRPSCDLERLFDNEDLDETIDDELVEKFGYESVSFYLSKKLKVYNIPSDHDHRKNFEKLVDVGLAVRGKNVSLRLILESMKLKEMNALVADLNPPKFSRKVKAVEYLETTPDILDRLDKAVSFRTLFQINPLPKEFSHINLESVSRAQRYAREICFLIACTYTMGVYALRDKNQYEEYLQDYKKGWKIWAANDDECCSYCQKASRKKYSKKNYPIVPLHIGCRCSVHSIDED